MPVDSRIIQDCKKNKRKGVEALYKESAGWMLGVARRYIQDRNEAMSMVNMALLSALKHIETFDESKPQKIEAWLKTILIRKLIDYQRKNQKETKVIDITEMEYQPVNSHYKADENAHIEELKAMIHSLPTQAKTVFNLYAIEGYKHKEIAVMLQISEGTSKWHLSEARKMLQAKLEGLEQIQKNVSI
jgi:RNA polymerase sigma-70 factor (ECF subfamily)